MNFQFVRSRTVDEVIFMLEQFGPLTVKELSHLLYHRSPTSVSTAVKNLFQRGFVVYAEKLHSGNYGAVYKLKEQA